MAKTHSANTFPGLVIHTEAEACWLERNQRVINGDAPLFSDNPFNRDTRAAKRTQRLADRASDRVFHSVPPVTARGDVALRRKQARGNTTKADRRDWIKLLQVQSYEVGHILPRSVAALV